MADILSIAISLIKGIKPRDRLSLGFYFSSIEEFEQTKPFEMIQMTTKGISYNNPANAELVRRARKIAEDVERSGARAVSYWDREYPPLLREMYDSPYMLYIRGTLPKQDRPAVAIVGTRHPSPAGRKAAFSLAAELGLAGLPIISGLAAGIDAAAHWGTLKTQQQTVAIMGNGIDRVYPSSNSELAGRILQNGGALISEYPPFTPASRFRFPERNRIISGIARALVVVQAPEKSGALITADHALDQNKEVYVHSAGTYGRRGAGALRLSGDGGMLIENAKKILDAWRIPMDECLETLQLDSFTPSQRLEEELDGRLLRFDGLWYRRVG
ncbi:MAG: DNA-processing protein DprA [Spirochaetia bacterium]|nr:DNA-processing protein DprA [Spirochaetia bacterium]